MGSGNFTPRSDDELDNLSDEDLIAYLQAARGARRPDGCKRALQFLVYRYEANVTARVRLKVPGHAVDLVAGQALVSAMQAAFDGTSVGQFRSLLNTITDRRIADYTRRERPAERPLPEEHEGDEDFRAGRSPTDAGHDGDEDLIERIDVRAAIDRVMARLSDEHREVVDLRVFEDLASAEVASRVEGMTVANVDKIASRFREAMRGELEGDNPG